MDVFLFHCYYLRDYHAEKTSTQWWRVTVQMWKKNLYQAQPISLACAAAPRRLFHFSMASLVKIIIVGCILSIEASTKKEIKSNKLLFPHTLVPFILWNRPIETVQISLQSSNKRIRRWWKDRQIKVEGRIAVALISCRVPVNQWVQGERSLLN